ncbi:MAG: hypothetical protein LBH46_00085 [Rickettsiales bacterium]|nr:hypothetical protein [Rickettsiales bacterium]
MEKGQNKEKKNSIGALWKKISRSEEHKGDVFYSGNINIEESKENFLCLGDSKEHTWDLVQIVETEELVYNEDEDDGENETTIKKVNLADKVKTEKQTKIVNCGYLDTKSSKDEEYYKGIFKEQKIVVFDNVYKREEKHPDLIIYKDAKE